MQKKFITPLLLVIFLLFSFAIFFDKVASLLYSKRDMRAPAKEQLLDEGSSIVEATSSVLVAAQKKLYPVLRVVDGDTIDISLDGVKTRIRLIGINTPETVDPRRPVQCFGKEASAKAKELLLGQNISIELDASQDKYDKYGRLLAYVYLADGTFFNEKMIREGYAYEYTYRLPYTYQKEFKEAQRDASSAKRGLWADGACVKN